jgi:hypothetical protein
MISPVNIAPPKNWQDFELLCLKLWGEIWEIPRDIELNSDNAQGQQGVDIYGLVGLQYYGIQCKNKKLNLINGITNRITIKDIQEEIDKAKAFKPALGKLIIATSLSKDQKIEEYVREQNLENIRNGLFGVQICFWDYIERNIMEFAKTYNWYVKHEGQHQVRIIAVTFKEGKLSSIQHPKFQRNIEKYIYNPEPLLQLPSQVQMVINPTDSLYQQLDFLKAMEEQQKQKVHDLLPRIEWEQLCWFELSIRNTGQTVIEDYKIKLNFVGEFVEVGIATPSVFNSLNFNPIVREYSNSIKSLYVQPREKILVQNDGYLTNSFYVKPVMDKPATIILYWTLIARDFECSGKLDIEIVPLYHTVTKIYNAKSLEEEHETQSISLISRPGYSNMMHGGASFLDKMSDYTFE